MIEARFSIDAIFMGTVMRGFDPRSNQEVAQGSKL
jgi:hypothetical protein